MTQSLAKLERLLGYHFKKKELLVTALTHRSMKGSHNERFEFLGDSILNFVVGNVLFHQMPHAKEGDLSRYRALLVCEETLATLAQEFHLSDYLILGVGELKSGGFRRKSILADAVEAIIAAIFIDADILTCQLIVQQWYATRIADVVKMKLKKDPKSALQELLQSKKFTLPQYEVIEITGDAHDQTFRIKCSVEGLEYVTEGTGQSRRAAEQEAAEAYLKCIEKVKL
jgi:ribonuclease-3